MSEEDDLEALEARLRPKPPGVLAYIAVGISYLLEVAIFVLFVWLLVRALR